MMATATSQPSPSRHGLSSTEIYQRVKHMAARFEFRPNERINEIELAKKLLVSRTPLREVLNQLMVEGFVTRTQNKGFIGRSLDPKEILDLYEFRQGLECAIAVLACQRATTSQIDDLAAFAEASFHVPEDEDPERLCALDEEFHMRIAQMTGNLEYENVLSNINARIQYVRWIDMQRGRRGLTQSEHRVIVDALRRREPVLVSSLLEKHIGRRLDQIVEVVKAGFAEIYTRDSILVPKLGSL
jgi:DNA-binding GntR family transcriptional regulator